MLSMLDIAVDVNQKNPYQKKTEVVKKGGGGVSVFLLKVKKNSFFMAPLMSK